MQGSGEVTLSLPLKSAIAISSYLVRHLRVALETTRVTHRPKGSGMKTKGELLRDFTVFSLEYRRDLQAALDELDFDSLLAATRLIRNCKGLVWLAGNGGSASLASHMATDLQLAGIRAQALTDVAAITTYSNDVSYSDCISQQIKKLARPGDVVILISTSGNSANILQAAFQCAGIKLIHLTGKSGGDLHQFGGLGLYTPAHHTGVVQDVHQTMMHLICYWLIKGN